MTTTSFAATLFGPEDLRIVERPLDPLAPGMVRVRFGAGGICGSDMHYFRHARLCRDLAAGARPRDRGRGRGDRRRCAGRKGRRSRCRQSVALVRSLHALPRGQAEPVREHLLHGLGVEDAAHAGRLCQLFRRHSRAMREDPGSRVLPGCGSGRTARGLPARGGARRRRQRQARRAVRRGADRAPDHARGAPRRCRGRHGRRYRGRAAGLCKPARRRQRRGHFRRR